jgi:WXG100 family type VII secretion target
MELDGLRVDHAALEQTADDLAAAVTRMETRLRELESDLGPLRTAWAGEAQQAYLVAKARWDGAVEEMRALLASVSVQVRRSNADYRAADLRGARSFGA